MKHCLILVLTLLFIAAVPCIARADSKSLNGQKSEYDTCAGDDCSSPKDGCEEVQLYCIENPAELRFHCGFGQACTEVNSCSMYLPMSVCTFFGLRNGTYDSLALRHIVSERQIHEQREGGLLCLVDHEIQHAIDGSLLFSCEAEQSGFQAQLDCLQRLVNTYCSSSPVLSKPDCILLRTRLCEAEADRKFSACRCRVGAILQGMPCRECVSACETDVARCGETTGAVPVGACQRLNSIYCGGQ